MKEVGVCSLREMTRQETRACFIVHVLLTLKLIPGVLTYSGDDNLQVCRIGAKWNIVAPSLLVLGFIAIAWCLYNIILDLIKFSIPCHGGNIVRWIVTNYLVTVIKMPHKQNDPDYMKLDFPRWDRSWTRCLARTLSGTVYNLCLASL